MPRVIESSKIRTAPKKTKTLKQAKINSAGCKVTNLKTTKKAFSLNSEQMFMEEHVNEVTSILKDAVKHEIEKKQKKGLPVARYNAKTKQAYLEI